VKRSEKPPEFIEDVVGEQQPILLVGVELPPQLLERIELGTCALCPLAKPAAQGALCQQRTAVM
jgi:hypothetical protein